MDAINPQAGPIAYNIDRERCSRVVLALRNGHQPLPDRVEILGRIAGSTILRVVMFKMGRGGDGQLENTFWGPQIAIGVRVESAGKGLFIEMTKHLEADEVITLSVAKHTILVGLDNVHQRRLVQPKCGGVKLRLCTVAQRTQFHDFTWGATRGASTFGTLILYVSTEKMLYYNPRVQAGLPYVRSWGASSRAAI